MNFNYIRNRISEYSKDDLLTFCYTLLDNKKDEIFPIWYVFAIMKWTIVYGGRKYPSKVLTPEKFNKLYEVVSNFNPEHISKYIKQKEVDKAFQIIYNQQFYLQKSVYREKFATQLILFSQISGKYDIEKSFKDKTGFSVLDFLFIEQLVWLYINIDKLNKPGLYFDGYLDNDFWNLAIENTSVEKVRCFINLITLNPNNAEESISTYRHNIRKEDLQTMEMSFFTMYPLVIYHNRIKLVHPSLFNHSINYYIYDFLKNNDNSFTTEFGYRLERYFELGLKELNLKYRTENELKKILPSKHNITDFKIEEENIYIECKATELQAYPYVNPTDELIFNSLKSSIFKAYFEQLVPVSKFLGPKEENWGIIITYKELYWSCFSELFNIGKNRYDKNITCTHLPPENVFIIDIYTWDNIVQIVKDKKATLKDILQTAKKNNSKPETYKQLFSMHLDIYKIERIDLNYLNKELNKFELEK